LPEQRSEQQPSQAVAASVQRTVEAVWRIESARLIAALARVTGDVGLAEDLAQDALVAALEQWPGGGVPDNPGAWLTAVARRRYVDTIRRAVTFERKAAELDVLARLDTKTENPMDELEFDAHVTDDVLKLIFTACHPVLSRDGRVALTLKLVGGLSTEQVARAFLVPTPTMAARITRAKKALADAQVGFEVPVGPELAHRFASVLEVVYLIFNEGYAATSGESWYRAELCDEAMRLGRMLSALAPDEPEAHGLVALMEIQASRIPARTGPGGQPVTLLDQDRARWNRLLITHGLAALAKAAACARSAAGTASRRGPYVIQAELAACHARAVTAADTDWRGIVSLYETLGGLAPSPVIELNRAVAVAMADGPAQALAIVDELTDDPALRGYHLLPAVRGDLLARLGRADQAREEFERAAALTANDSERAHLLRRAATAAAAAAGGALAHPVVRRRGRDLDQAGPFEDRARELGRVAVDVLLAHPQRRPRPLGRQRPVDAAAAPLRLGRAAPDPGEVGPRNRVNPPGADDRPVRLGHPQLELVTAGQPSQRAREHLVAVRIAEDLVLHRHHRPDIRLLGDSAQRHAVRQRHVHRQRPRVADHDRFRVIGSEPVGKQRLVQARSMVVPPGLPLHLADRRVRLVVRERLRHHPPDGVGVRPAQVLVGDEPAAAGEGHQPQRALPGNGERAGGLGVGAKLAVVGRQQAG
jgi:RNA polymerase sigma factor (sigma-70 family)